ncbi:MAG: cell division protein ZapA [Bacteroidaceae bacterium]|nr:cell division protein ZapA [Bacteroidaceae bacterium]
MTSNSDLLTIQLNIGSRIFPITIKRKDEEIYREASKLINDKLQKYISTFPDQEKEDYVTMVALDIAISLIKEKNFDDQLQEVVSELNKHL